MKTNDKVIERGAWIAYHTPRRSGSSHYIRNVYEDYKGDFYVNLNGFKTYVDCVGESVWNIRY